MGGTVQHDSARMQWPVIVAGHRGAEQECCLEEGSCALLHDRCNRPPLTALISVRFGHPEELASSSKCGRPSSASWLGGPAGAGRGSPFCRPVFLSSPGSKGCVTVLASSSMLMLQDAGNLLPSGCSRAVQLGYSQQLPSSFAPNDEVNRNDITFGLP